MNSVKLLHTADFHIGAELGTLGTLAESRRYETLETFGRVCKVCSENKIEFCLISGDLFDSNKAGAAFIDSVLGYIKAAGTTQFLYVAGNHDPLDPSSPFKEARLPENLHIFGTEFEIKEFAESGVRFIGKSFAHSSMKAESFTDVLPDDGFINIMLLHGDLSADKESPYNPINREFVESLNVDYLALGHIHKRTGIARMGDTYLSYPGCPEGQGFDEGGIKGAYIGTISKGSCELSFKRLCRRCFHTVNADMSAVSCAAEAAEAILSKLKSEYGEGFAENLYKIVLTGRNKAYSRIKAAEILALVSPAVYFVKLENKIKPDFDLEQLKSEKSLKGIFVKRMLEKLQAANDAEKEVLENALYLGLAAFDSEVAYNED